MEGAIGRSGVSKYSHGFVVVSIGTRIERKLRHRHCCLLCLSYNRSQSRLPSPAALLGVVEFMLNSQGVQQPTVTTHDKVGLEAVIIYRYGGRLRPLARVGHEQLRFFDSPCLPP